MLRLIQRYLRDFQLCCSRLVVIGFNSGKYVLNLIKQKLPKYLDLQTKSGAIFFIEKKNNYTSIANDKLKCLDMTNYLPPGTSYGKFLKTFDIEQRKSFFHMSILQTYQY